MSAPARGAAWGEPMSLRPPYLSSSLEPHSPSSHKWGNRATGSPRAQQRPSLVKGLCPGSLVRRAPGKPRAQSQSPDTGRTHWGQAAPQNVSHRPGRMPTAGRQANLPPWDTGLHQGQRGGCPDDPEAGCGPPAGRLRMESFLERNACGVVGRCIPRRRPVSRTLICTN